MCISSSGRAAAYRRKSLAGEASCASYLSSGGRMFAGGHRFPGIRTPAKPPWSEVTIFLDAFLRQSTPLQEESPYRRRALCQLSQFRRENVRRRTSISRQPNSGEAAVVGGDDLFGCSSPAEQPLTGGKSLSEKSVVPANSVPASECSPEDIDFPAAELRRSRRGRR